MRKRTDRRYSQPSNRATIVAFIFIMTLLIGAQIIIEVLTK